MARKSTKKGKEKETVCNDVNCPRHGTLSTRGIVLEGVVTSDKMNGTVIVQRNYRIKSKKYDRYKSAKSRIPAHNPPCINAKMGDNVRIMECRKLSKTVSFVVTEKV
nr:ribosomal protein S17 [uncultured archaeon]